ncbi:MAG: conjugative transposon protein TraK [Segetibacter sp.]
MNLIQNIETKIKLSLFISVASLITAIIISAMSFSYARRMITAEKSQIYVLDHNVPLVAVRTNILDNRQAEYKATVETFHDLFFSLPPDNEYIENQLKKSMFLIDASGLAQYNTLKEKGYYSGVISTSSVITCTKDSILLDMNTKEWKFYGKEKIERPSSITIRSIVTTGNLQDVPRTDNNPHGVMITNWRTLENKDIKNEPKRIF